MIYWGDRLADYAYVTARQDMQRTDRREGWEVHGPCSGRGDPVIKQDGEECAEQGTCRDKDRMGAATRADMQSVCGGGLCVTQRKTSNSYN